jgi:predicted GIY-YIG superfamily endonuclease
MVSKSYYVYIMTNNSKTLYTGVTNDLERRVHQHKLKQVPGFTTKYNITKLVYYEETGMSWRLSRGRRRSRGGFDPRK